MRWNEAVFMDQVGDQYVIEMAAMTGHIDDFMAQCIVWKLIKIIDLDTVVDAMPKPGNQDFCNDYRRIGIIGCDFAYVLCGLAAGLVMCNTGTAGLFFGGRTNGGVN